MGGSGVAGFVRARLTDLEQAADQYHRYSCAVLFARSCDCGEPNRRRRRAFTHRNLVDWAERWYTDDPGALNLAVPLGHLAAEWSDHPDYLTEWAP